MLMAAFASLGVALLLGTALAIFYLRPEGGGVAPRRLSAWPLAALHGVLGVGGLACLLLALRGPPRGVENGTASFGTISVTLLVLAAMAGSAVLATHLIRRRRAGTLIAIHATLAVSGFVILAAYVLV